MHRLPSELLHVISKSSNGMISTFFKKILQEAAERLNDKAMGPGRKRGSKKKAVLERFRLDLQGLMDSMKDTETRYIRCVKPNDTLTPGKVNHVTVMRQLQCAGLVTAIDLSRETYPNKLSLDFVADRFDCLMSEPDRGVLQEMPPYDKAQYMLSKLYAPLLEIYRNCEFTMPYACGKTKVYFRSGALEMLESLRFEFFSKWATIIQKNARQWLAKQKVERAWKGLIVLQATARTLSLRTRFTTIRSGIILIQSTYKAKRQRKLFELNRRGAVLIQSRWRFVIESKNRQKQLAALEIIVSFFRTIISRSSFLHQKLCCCKIQAVARGYFVRKNFRCMVEGCIRIQSFGRRIVALNRHRKQKHAAHVLGTFGRKVAYRVLVLRSALRLQSLIRRALCRSRRLKLKGAAQVVCTFLRFATQRMKFIKLYVATVKIQAKRRMVLVKRDFSSKRDAVLTIQAFFRMTRDRISFITVYMATLRLQSFIRDISERNKQVSSALASPVRRVLSSDISEIYTIATSDSKDALNNKSSSIGKSQPVQNPATGILQQWVAGAFGKEETLQAPVLPNINPLMNFSQSPDKSTYYAESIPSITAESDSSSCTSCDGADETSQSQSQANCQDGNDIKDKDTIIRNLRLQLDDMKEQEKILREEIAAVVDLAKEHEQMVGEEYEDRIQAYEDEVVNLKNMLQQSEREKEILLTELESVKQEQAKQLVQFQLHARTAQESHKDYIRKVSMVLDEANEARKRETTKILTELETLKLKKNEEILQLKNEIVCLKSMEQRSTRLGSLEHSELMSELRQLENAIMSAIKPDRVAVVVERAERRPWSKEAFIDEKVSLRVGQYVSRLVELAGKSGKRPNKK